MTGAANAGDPRMSALSWLLLGVVTLIWTAMAGAIAYHTTR
jgi:hypothetical protein